MTEKNSKALMELIVKAGDDRLGEDIVALDVRNLTTIADYFVLMNGRNQRQVKALVDAIDEAITKNGYPLKGIEGKSGHDWILLDANDVIVHIFTEEARELFNLEKLWNDAPLVNVSAILEDEA
ncbi:MAG: ribosome silencing factor [Aerococcus sp.]|nr:ribosome silencing factor [Aerococcus sp.]